LIALVISVLRFRGLFARLSIVAAVSALMVWLALCAGATILAVQVGIIGGGLLVLSGCDGVLHRLVRRSVAAAPTPSG
jgi:hypothetical protein